VKFACECGQVIRDQTDYLPYKASVLRDEDDERFWDGVNGALAAFVAAVGAGCRDAWVAEHFGPDYRGNDALVIENLLLGPWIQYTVHAYECEACGRLHVEPERGPGGFVTFQPQSGRVERVFASRFGSPRPRPSTTDTPAG
jgi:hypothetical protein